MISFFAWQAYLLFFFTSGVEFQKDEAYELLQQGDLLVRLFHVLGDCLKQDTHLSLQLAAADAIRSFLAWGRIDHHSGPGDAELDVVPPLASIDKAPFNDRIVAIALIPDALTVAVQTLLAIPPTPLSTEAANPFTATLTAKAQAKAKHLPGAMAIAAAASSPEVVPDLNATTVLEAVLATVRDIALGAVGARELVRVGVCRLMPPLLHQSYTVPQVPLAVEILWNITNYEPQAAPQLGTKPMLTALHELLLELLQLGFKKEEKELRNEILTVFPAEVAMLASP